MARRVDFVRVQTGGRRFRGPRLVVLVDRGEPARVRVGYTVSRRVGKAVVRNRVRRRLREIVRLHQELLVAGRDYVIVSTAAAVPATYAEIEAELLGLLGGAQAWAGDRSPAPGPGPATAR